MFKLFEVQFLLCILLIFCFENKAENGFRRNPNNNKLTNYVCVSIVNKPQRLFPSKDTLCIVFKDLEKKFVFLYSNSNDQSKLKALDEISDLLERNKIVIQMGIHDSCQGLSLHVWFYENCSIKFINEVDRLGNSFNTFNSFEYLCKIMYLYKNDAETNEYLSEKLAQIAFDNPINFCTYIDGLSTQQELEKILHFQLWEKIDANIFDKKIVTTKQYTLIHKIVFGQQ